MIVCEEVGTSEKSVKEVTMSNFVSDLSLNLGYQGYDM